MFGWGWKCRHLIYQSGLKHWVSRCAIVFFLWACDLWVYFSHMDIIPSVLYLTVSTSKCLNKLEAASCPGWWDLACSWRCWIRYWLVCEAYCPWWYLLNLWGVYVDGQFSRFALLQNTIGFQFLFIASDFWPQFYCLTLTARIEMKKRCFWYTNELPVV